MDVSPSDGGIVTMGQVALSSYPSTFTFNEGEHVSLEAVPASGYRFENWSGTLSGTTNPTTIVMDCDKNVTANFSQTITTQLNWLLSGIIGGLVVVAVLFVIVRHRGY